MQNSSARMHQCIFGLVGLMAMFAVTIPIAMQRVSSTEKFANQPFNSQTCEAQKPEKRRVVSWLETCRYLTVVPVK